MDYWLEAIECSFDEAGIIANEDQIKSVAQDMDNAHDSYAMAFPGLSGPSQTQKELAAAYKTLCDERAKIMCSECGGKGQITESFGPCGRSSNSQCDKCHGEGRHAP